MKALIKFHFYYLFNKQTLGLLIASILLSTFSFYANITSSPYLTISEEINIYFQTSLAITKIILAFLMIIIYTLAMYKDHDFYIYYLIPIKRSKYIGCKLLLLFFMSMIIFMILFGIYLLVGFIFNKYFYYQDIFIEAFFTVLLISLNNGLYGMLLMQLINNIFVIFIPFGFVMISSNLNFEGFEKVLAFIIPSEYYGIGYLLWLFIILNVINLSFYCHRDLNY